ncbi:MAG: MOSC domain-containing protein [Pseudomonadota bacterium]
MSVTIEELLNELPQIGKVEWIGVRPARRAPVIAVDSVLAEKGRGLQGDRYSGKSGKRDVTLIQHEHLAAIASCLGCNEIRPESLRRNIAVSGINLLALKSRHFQIGNATLEFTGLCHPCSFMQETFGPGGYNAVRGHGGITARVVDGGSIKVGDSVSV